MIKKREYLEMDENDPKSATFRFRYQLLSNDYSTVYRKYYRKIGLDPKKPPEQNIDGWLDPRSPTYNRRFAETVASYTARTESGGRLELAFCDDEMIENARKYAHVSLARFSHTSLTGNSLAFVNRARRSSWTELSESASQKSCFSSLWESTKGEREYLSLS
jgi:hypothetical protein